MLEQPKIQKQRGQGARSQKAALLNPIPPHPQEKKEVQPPSGRGKANPVKSGRKRRTIGNGRTWGGGAQMVKAGSPCQKRGTGSITALDAGTETGKRRMAIIVYKVYRPLNAGEPQAQESELAGKKTWDRRKQRSGICLYRYRPGMPRSGRGNSLQFPGFQESCKR